LDLTTLATRNYTYLPNGLVSQIAETANGQTRTAKRSYDSFDRLVSYQDLTGARRKPKTRGRFLSLFP